MQQLRKGLLGGLLVLLSLGAAVNLNAKTWKVYPTMTRAAIQSVIDQAKDKDQIRFYAGTYDFSATPFSTETLIVGALTVTDKSLSFVANKGTILVGTESILDPTSGIGTSGILAFVVKNSEVKDISFKGFTFQKFLMAISSGIQTSTDPDTGGAVMALSCRDFTVQNCTFQDIARTAITAMGVKRNIKILNNEITWSLRMGIFIDWYWVGDHLGSQPKSGKITIENNDVHARLECVYINRGYNMSIKNNSFDADGSDTESTGLAIYGGANAAGIVNNDFTNLFYGLDLNGEKVAVGESVYSYPVTRCNITNNMFIAENPIFLGNEPCYANKITNNTIALGGPYEWACGILVYESYNDTFINNKISGYGPIAIAVEGHDPGSGGSKAYSHNEYFKGNSVKNFTASWCDYYMNSLTKDNTAIGTCSANAIYNATYVDEGVNNQFKCIFPAGSPAPLSMNGAPLSMNGFGLSKRNRSDRKPLTN